MNSAYALWLGEYDDRRMTCLYATRELAEGALFKLALTDERPVAPEIEELAIVHNLPGLPADRP